jgi:glycosyltransferase involved in cell wall biosynthesis
MKLHRLKVAIIGQYPKEDQIQKVVFTGIMRVVHGLTEELKAFPNVQIETPTKGLKHPKNVGPYLLRGGLSFLRNLLLSKTEVFHIHGVSFPMFLSLIIAKLKRKKTIYTAHGLVSREIRLGYRYSPFSRFFEFFLIKFSNHITTPSENMRKMIVTDYSVDIKKISVIENGVSRSFFDENTKHTERPPQLQKLKGKHLILFVGGTQKAKGLHFLLKSIALLKKQRRDFILLVAGRTNDSALLLSRYTDLLKEEYVKFLGRISHSKLSLIYDFIDILVLPSAYESFGLTVLEAMAKGKVVIVTDRVGVSSIITNNEDGVIIPYGDVNRLVYEIDRLLSDKRMRDKMGVNARETAKKYTWEQIAPKYLRCYTQVLSL